MERAYRRLMALYDPSSPGIGALYTPQEIQRMRAKIEEAYRRLSALESTASTRAPERPLRPPRLPPEEIRAIVEAEGGMGGKALRRVRERLGLTLEEAAAVTKITKGTLKYIEDERLELLPAWVYLKGFLKAYAKFLGVDPEAITAYFEAKGPRQ